MTSDNEKAKAKEGWGWVRIIQMLEAVLLEVIGNPHYTPYQDQFTTRHLRETITGLHENAGAAFSESTLKHLHSEFRHGVNGEMIARGILTHSEYWQRFIRVCDDNGVV